MSDPVSSMDVEDVLSSIRRLVSEEAKGAETLNESGPDTIVPDIHEQAENAVEGAIAALSANADETPLALGGEVSEESLQSGTDAGEAKMSFRHQAAQARAAADQKLVLTAALRVADPGESEAQGAAIADERALKMPEKAARSSSTPPQRPQRPHLHSVSDMNDETMASLSPSGPSEQAQQRPEGGRSSRFDVAPDDTLFERARRAMQAVTEEAETPPPAYVFPGDTEEVETASQDDSAQQFEQALSAEPEETMSPQSPVDADIEAPETDVTRTETETEIDIETETETETETEPELAPDAASPFSTKDGAFPAQPEDAGDLPSTINFAEEEESILDEDTLRDLVSEMVRSELQGELGDRITRNVRKLVRREIQRTLASREFE